MAPRKNTTTTRTPSKRKDTSKGEIGSVAPADAAGFGSNAVTRRWLLRAKHRSVHKSSSAHTRFSSRAAVLMATIWPTGSRPKGN
jgi:hypothetical protein